MAIWCLALLGVYLAVAFGWRTALQYRLTGESGFRRPSGAAGSLPWGAGVLFVVAISLGLAAPLLALAGLAPPFASMTGPGVRSLGLALYAAGFVLTVVAQAQMGTSWRVGVDPGEWTELVLRGVFDRVRNPIFSGLMLVSFGLALLLPTAVAWAAAAALLVAIELQVRVVEEPYLFRTHGERYQAYAARAGRFLPGVGRLEGDGK